MVTVRAMCEIDVDMIQPYKYNDKTIIGVHLSQEENEYTNEITNNIGVLYDNNFYEVLNDDCLLAQVYKIETIGRRMIIRGVLNPQ
jgi:hypothetical protein